MTHADESDLREQFARVREGDRADVPAFETLTTPRAVQRRTRLPMIAVSLVAAAALITLFVRDRQAARAHDASGVLLRSARWSSPTDFLLEVPGDWVLTYSPRVHFAAPQIDSTSTRRTSS